MNEEIREANRYLTNAKEILSQKTGKENGAYSDKKYVLMVGHSAYMGVLHALDQLNLPNNKKEEETQWSITKYFLIDTIENCFLIITIFIMCCNLAWVMMEY